MIAKIIRGADFAGLLSYLRAARKNVERSHVEAHHIVDLDRAADEMALVARGARHSARVRRPVAHIIVSWGSDEAPTVSAQKATARAILGRIGLAENQSIIVVHNEAKRGVVPGPGGRHHEVHIAVNRVRLDGSVAKLRNDFAMLEQACAAIASENSWTVVPGRFNAIGTMPREGLGNRVGSIAAQTGALTIAEEIRADDARMNRLRDARRQGWIPLLGAFLSQGIALVPGPARRQEHLSRGLVMVDSTDHRRKLKLSALSSEGENWSSIALVRELGPMPKGWEKTADIEEMLSPVPAIKQAKTSSKSAPEVTKNPVGLAAALLADPAGMECLRAARQEGWPALITAFAQVGIRLELGVTKARGVRGLVMVSAADTTRREKISALDTPLEKWGLGALTRSLGPAPRFGADPDPPRQRTPPHLNKTAHDLSKEPAERGFQRAELFERFRQDQEIARRHNAEVRERGAIERKALWETQKRDRDRHHRLRRWRRMIIRELLGNSIEARLLNRALDRLFEQRLKRLAETHAGERRCLSANLATAMKPLPTWTAVLRAARLDHEKAVQSERNRRREAAWLDGVRQRRDQLRNSATALTRLERVRSQTDARIRRTIAPHLTLIGADPELESTVVRQLASICALDPAGCRRLPAVVAGVRQELALAAAAHVNARKCDVLVDYGVYLNETKRWTKEHGPDLAEMARTTFPEYQALCRIRRQELVRDSSGKPAKEVDWGALLRATLAEAERLAFDDLLADWAALRKKSIRSKPLQKDVDGRTS